MFDYNWLLIPNNKIEEYKNAAKEVIKNYIQSEYMLLAKENNFELVVATLPMLYELKESNFEFYNFCNCLLIDESLLCIDLFNEIKLQKNTLNFKDYNQLYWPIDLHNNSKGQLIWAKIIAEKLKK